VTFERDWRGGPVFERVTSQHIGDASRRAWRDHPRDARPMAAEGLPWPCRSPRHRGSYRRSRSQSCRIIRESSRWEETRSVDRLTGSSCAFANRAT
jgi:hypothetical protein